MAEYITCKQAQKIAELGKLEMRKLLRDGIVASSRTETGAWLVDKDSLLLYCEKRKRDKDNAARPKEAYKTIILRLQRENAYLKSVLTEHKIQFNIEDAEYQPVLAELDLPPRILKVLNSHGIESAELLSECSEDELLALPGIGVAAIKQIKAALAKMDLELYCE